MQQSSRIPALPTREHQLKWSSHQSEGVLLALEERSLCLLGCERNIVSCENFSKHTAKLHQSKLFSDTRVWAWRKQLEGKILKVWCYGNLPPLKGIKAEGSLTSSGCVVHLSGTNSWGRSKTRSSTKGQQIKEHVYNLDKKELYLGIGYAWERRP